MASKTPKSETPAETLHIDAPAASNEPLAGGADAPAPDDAPAPAAASSPETASRPSVSIEDAYTQYVSGLATAGATFELQYQRQVAAYTGKLQQAERQIAQALGDAARRYSDELQAAWNQVDLGAKLSSAYQRFCELSDEQVARGESQRALADAYAGFLAGLGQAAAQPGATASTARHRAYLEAIRKAWEQAELQKQALEAHAEFLLLQQQLQQQGWQRSHEAQRTYEQAVKQALSSDLLAQALPEIQQAWQQACQDYTEDASKALQTIQGVVAPKNQTTA